jgi:hypothetical protein
MMKRANALASHEITASEQRSQLQLPIAEKTAPPRRAGMAGGAWRGIRNLVLWSYERGTLQYDLMVTLILAFIFVAPYFVNFNDKPVEHTPHPTGVVVIPDGNTGFVYQVEASAVTGTADEAIRAQLLRVIEPIAGEVTITRYEKAKDPSGRRIYKVWVER